MNSTSKEARAKGFTLLELLLGLSIVAMVLVILFGGFRIGLEAWRRGEERTATLDRARSLSALLERALAGAFPYRTAPEGQAAPRILFEGLPDRLTFATLSPPFPIGAPAAFTAVSLSGEATGLALRQQILPAATLTEQLTPILVDTRTTAVRFRYLGPEPEAWQDTWDVGREESLPRAIAITWMSRDGARGGLQTLTVPIRAAAP